MPILSTQSKYINVLYVLHTMYIQYVNISSISGYAMVNHDDYVLLMGGESKGNQISTIAKYEHNQWTNVGSLLNPRSGHSAIINEGRIIVVGGAGER